MGDIINQATYLSNISSNFGLIVTILVIGIIIIFIVAVLTNINNN